MLVKSQMVFYQGRLEMQLRLIVLSPMFSRKEEDFYKKYLSDRSYENEMNVMKVEKA